ncbi:MAG: hypothetical protein ACWGQW_02035 [bacterium]
MATSKTRWIPQGYILSMGDTFLGVQVYTSDAHGFHAIGYSGKRSKHDFNYYFKTAEARQKYLDQWYAGLRERSARRIAQRAQEQAIGRDLEVGDVLVATWGYEQTNRNYYQVVRLVGKASVAIREVGSSYKSTGYLQGTSKPIRDNFIGEEMVKRAKAGRVTVSSVQRASKGSWDREYFESSYA